MRVSPCLRCASSVGRDASGVSDRAGCAGTCVPTSTEMPIGRGSVTRSDGQGVNRGNGSGSRACRAVTLARHYRPFRDIPVVRGPLDRTHDRPSRPLGRDDQGVLLRPDRGESAGGQGPVRGRVPRLRRLHPATQRKGRRLCVLQACHRGAIERRWMEERALQAMLVWELRYGRLPSSFDWPRTPASRSGGRGRLMAASHAKSMIGHRADLCAQSPAIRRNFRGSEVARSDRQNVRFAGISSRRAWVRALFGSVRSPVQIRAPRFQENPANAGLSSGRESVLDSVCGATSGSYCPFTAQTWPSTSALSRSRSSSLRRMCA